MSLLLRLAFSRSSFVSVSAFACSTRNVRAGRDVVADLGQVQAGGTWSKTPGKLWKVGETAERGARENPVFPPFLRLAAASIGRCCTCVPGVFDQMQAGGPGV